MEPIFDALEKAVSASDYDTKRRAYEALLKRQQPENGTVEGVVDLKDHLRRTVLILLPDLNCADENLASFALRCLGFYMHQSLFTSTLGDAKVHSVLDALVTSVKETNSKIVCSLALWCLQGNSFPANLVAPHVPSLVDAMVRALENPWGSATCVYKAQLLIAKLARQVSREMKAYAHSWGPRLLGTLLSEVKRIREKGDEVLGEAGAILAMPGQDLSEAITASLTPQCVGRILELAKTKGSEQAALTAWSWHIRLSGELLITKDMLINKLLPVLECTFGSANPSVWEASFGAWRALIDALTQPYVGTTRDAQNSPAAKAGAKSLNTPKAKEGGHVAPSVRRLKLLMTPLMANLSQETEPQVRLACLHTWEYLIQRLSHWLKSSSVFKLIAQPVYSLILGPNAPRNAAGKNEEKRAPVLFSQVVQHFVRFLDAVPSGEKKTGSPVGTGSLERGSRQPAEGSGAEEALEVLWDVKQVSALVEILGLVRDQAFLDGTISALDVSRSAKGREGRLEGTGPPSPLLPAAISGAAVDATGPKGLAGKRVGAPGPVREQVEASAGEALLAGWVALLMGIARAGRTQMRPSEEHVAAVHSLLALVAETMTRANESVLATWQLVRVLVSELGAVVLASVSYSLPLPKALAGGASGKGLGVSTPRKWDAEAAELFTPGAFLLAVWLSTVSPLFPLSSDTNPPRISQERGQDAAGVGELGVKVTHQRVKAGVNELVDLSCGRLDVLVGASRLVRVLEVLTGVTSSEPVIPSSPKGRQETTDVFSGHFNMSPGLLMYTWQEVTKQVMRLVIRANDIPTKGAGQAVCTVLLLPLRVLGAGGFSQGLEEGFEETLDAAMHEWALLWEAAYRVTQLKNVQSNMLVQSFCHRLLHVLPMEAGRTNPPSVALLHALSTCLSTIVSHLEITSNSSLAMSKNRRRMSSNHTSPPPSKDAAHFLGKHLDDQNGVQDLSTVLAHALHVTASQWLPVSDQLGSRSAGGLEGQVSGVEFGLAADERLDPVSVSLMSVITSLLEKLSGQSDVLLVLQPLLTPLRQWLAITHAWKPAPLNSQIPNSQATQDVNPVVTTLTALCSQLLSKLQKCRPSLGFDSQTLETLSPLLEHSLGHSHQPIANRALLFWEETFAKSGGKPMSPNPNNRSQELTRGSYGRVSQGRTQTQGATTELIYPAELVPILTRLRSKVEISLPNWSDPEQTGSDREGIDRTLMKRASSGFEGLAADVMLTSGKVGTPGTARSLGGVGPVSGDMNTGQQEKKAATASEGGVSSPQALDEPKQERADLPEPAVGEEGEGLVVETEAGRPAEDAWTLEAGIRMHDGDWGGTNNERISEAMEGVPGGEGKDGSAGKAAVGRVSAGAEGKGTSEAEREMMDCKQKEVLAGKDAARFVSTDKKWASGRMSDGGGKTASLEKEATRPGSASTKRASETREDTPGRDRTAGKEAGRPVSADVEAKKRRKLDFLEDTQDGEFVAIPILTKRKTAPLTEHQKEARVKQQQQRRGVSTYTNLDASQAPWTSETQDEEEAPMELGFGLGLGGGKGLGGILDADEARTGFGVLERVAGENNEGSQENVKTEIGEVEEGWKGNKDEKGAEELIPRDAGIAKGVVSGMGAGVNGPSDKVGSFFGAGGVSTEGGPTDRKVEKDAEVVGRELEEIEGLEKERFSSMEDREGDEGRSGGVGKGGTVLEPAAEVIANTGGIQGAVIEVGGWGLDLGLKAVNSRVGVKRKAGEDNEEVGGPEIASVRVRVSPEKRPKRPDEGAADCQDSAAEKRAGEIGLLETDGRMGCAKQPVGELCQLGERKGPASGAHIGGTEPLSGVVKAGEKPPQEAIVWTSVRAELRPCGVGMTGAVTGLSGGKNEAVTGLTGGKKEATGPKDAAPAAPASEEEQSETLPLPVSQDEMQEDVLQPVTSSREENREVASKAPSAEALRPVEERMDGGHEIIGPSLGGTAQGEAEAHAKPSKAVPSQERFLVPALLGNGRAVSQAGSEAKNTDPSQPNPENPVTNLGGNLAAGPTLPEPVRSLTPAEDLPSKPLVFPHNPVPNQALNPAANPPVLAESGPPLKPDANRIQIPVGAPVTNPIADPNTNPPVLAEDGPVFPELIGSEAPVKHVLNNLPRSARQVLLAGAVKTVGDLARMECGELRNKMPIKAAVQIVRNALRAFIEREERKKANSQETPVVSQTPTDTEDASQPSDSDARAAGRLHQMNGRGVLKYNSGEMENSVSFEEEGRAEPEPGVAETQESVLSSPKASRKRIAPEGIGSAEKRTKGGGVTETEQRADSAQGQAEKEAGGSDKGTVVGNEAEQLAGEPGVLDEREAMWNGKDGLRDDGKSEKCVRLEGDEIGTVCGNGGKEMAAQMTGEGEAAGGSARNFNGQSKEMGIEGRHKDGSAVNEQLLSNRPEAAGDRRGRGWLLQVLKGPREAQLEVSPTGMGTPRKTALTHGEGDGKAEEGERGEVQIGGAQLVHGEGVSSKVDSPIIEGSCDRNGGGKMEGLAESAVAEAAPAEVDRNQGTVQMDRYELALVGDGGVYDLPQYAQVPDRQRESIERNGEGVMGGRLSARPLLSKIQELLTDPGWENLDVVGLVEAQLLVSDLSSKITTCLRARAPDFFANR